MATPPTARERLTLGRAQRKHMRRADHAGWNPRLRKRDPLDLLAASMHGRVAGLIPLKYERMAVSPFGYFRGAVPVMAYDLSLSPNTGIHCQLCGDAHVRNLGAFESQDGRLVFDINDFDETVPGPFEWDVKRMAASLVVAGREAGAKDGHCREAASVFLERYRGMLHMFAHMPVLEVARFQVHRLQSIRPVSAILQTAARATPMHNLLSLTEPAAAEPKAAKKLPKNAPATSIAPPPPTGRIFKSQPPILTRIKGEEAQHAIDSLISYAETLLPERRRFLAQYRPLDVAFKVVGTGSVGLRDFCLYMQGNGAKDPLFLQIKEEAASGYTPYLGRPAGAPYHEGRRVVEGQRAMQLQSDPFLGWTTIQGRDYLVRQLNDHKASVDLADLKTEGLLEYAMVCGEILARGHARSGDCQMLSGYLGASDRFDRAIVRFAIEYADQTERDWQQLVRSRHTPKPASKKK